MRKMLIDCKVVSKTNVEFFTDEIYNRKKVERTIIELEAGIVREEDGASLRSDKTIVRIDTDNKVLADGLKLGEGVIIGVTSDVRWIAK